LLRHNDLRAFAKVGRTSRKNSFGFRHLASEPRKRGSWPLSRVLSRAIIPLGAVSPRPSSSLPGKNAGPTLRPVLADRRVFPYLALLQVGFAVPSGVATDAVRSYRTLSPLPAPCGASAVCSLLHFPWARAPQALPGTLSTGARTFLPASCDTRRLPGQLPPRAPYQPGLRHACPSPSDGEARGDVPASPRAPCHGGA
jgi:hypothetical protein